MECYGPLDSLHIAQLHLPSFENRGHFGFLSEGRQISKGGTSIRRNTESVIRRDTGGFRSVAKVIDTHSSAPTTWKE